MIVVSDTGPLNYLILIGESAVIPRLYRRLLIPRAVADELAAPAAPDAVREWLAAPPDWLDIRVTESALGPPTLHPGERETIALARTLQADLVLLDEKKGRAAARSQGLRVVGTLGVLAQAAAQDLIRLPDAVAKLRDTSFQVSDTLLAAVLAHAASASRE